jgi:hypothetical protein
MWPAKLFMGDFWEEGELCYNLGRRGNLVIISGGGGIML